MDSLDRYIDAVEHLPTPPVVMIQLISLFRQPDRDVDEVVNLLHRDPSLTAEVLRRCNTALISGGDKTVDIFDAIMRMGFYEVYQTAVAISARQLMPSKMLVGCIPADELWRHSAATAVVSGILAKEMGESEGVAYTAGLLHDIGKTLLALAEGPKYLELMRQMGTFGLSLKNAERHQFGFGHGAIGARLLERWNVPADISVPVSHHHDLDGPEAFARMSAIVHLGDALAHHLVNNSLKDSNELPEASTAIEALGIQNDQLVALAQLGKEELEGMALQA
jgi:putative nucleotidyltransferase with HDIG domain